MIVVRLALVAALLLPAACSTWNPLVALGIRNEPAHKPTPLAPINATVTPRAAWTAQVGKSGGFAFRPEVDGGRVYAAAADGSVSILDEASGRVLSKVETKKKLSGGVEVGEGKVIAGSVKGEVIALDASGKTAWTANVAGEVIAPPTVAAGQTVIVRTADGRIFGLSAEDGKRRWVYQRPTPALLLRSEAGVLAVGRNVVAGYPNGKLIALDVEDGKLTWEVNVSLPRGTTELERIADVAGLPIIDGDNVCAAAYQGKVACFEIGSRNLVWARDLSSSRGIASDARHFYVVDDEGGVHALDKKTGASVWKNDKLLHRRIGSPVTIDGKVLVADGFGFVHVLAPDDGALIGRLATDGSAVRWLVLAGEGVLAQTDKGSVAMVKF
ncbi:MAG TPA: outer membrane protein assembly factor BamB [Usitatibacter sp.]|nr:outer membrane protein assembly factor BamB [Usitatibacter sp.]